VTSQHISLPETIQTMNMDQRLDPDLILNPGVRQRSLGYTALNSLATALFR
jgi:hypothetical protein